MSLKRDYNLNMPQLLWGGLSENWLLKELGDIHWQQITSALNTPSDQLTDSRGERLYASFVRLCWSGANISHFTENKDLSLESSLSRYGSKMFFSETIGTGKEETFKANLMSVFSTREKSDNTKLKKGTLKAEIDSDTVTLHAKLPEVAKVYLENKGEIFDSNNKLLPNAIPNFIYQKKYIIDAYDDINGVGLLYFASYPKINDKCEREYIISNYDLSGDWLEIAGVVSRDIHYYGNANSGDELLYELNSIEQNDNEIILHSSIYRTKDQQLIARVFTTKHLQDNSKFEKKKKSLSTKTEDLKIAKSVSEEKSIVTQNSQALTDLDQNVLNDIVVSFFKKILEVKTLDKNTSLSEFGIESIVYQELSEFLFEEYNIDANPSRFYGASTINALTDYLLGKEDTSHIASSSGANSQRDDIAIVGISCRLPGASNKEAFWENLKANKDSITEVNQERWNWKEFNANPEETQKAKWGGFIDGVGNFDPLFFGISPFEAELMDPQQRITLEAVYTALEDANIVPSSLKGSNTGVYVGVSGSDYAHITREARKDKVQAYDAIGNASSILANRISYLLDIHGPNKAIDTACSSSLVAVDEAVKSIRNGVSDIAIAGGVHTMLRPELTVSYHEAGMLSKDGKCKTFDDAANGYVRGEGVGIIVMKSLEKAKADGDYIYGVIKGSAVNHGGKANTLTSPNPQAQKALLLQAYTDANVDVEDVSYVEAHGTGTPLGDPIEIEALKLAFESLQAKNSENHVLNYCGIGSVKTNIGHLEAGAGIAGLIKVLLCMKNKALPGNTNLKNQNKYINLENSPFYLRKETSDWVVNNKKRIAGVSSFGFGGVNAHVVLEEYINQPKVYKSLDDVLIVLSAKNTDRLQQKVSDLKTYLNQHSNLELSNLAYTLQYGREEMEERLAFQASSIEEVIQKLEAYENQDYGQIYLGNAKKENCDFLLEGEAGEAYMDIVISKKQYQLLAQLWVKGIAFDWSFLYGTATPNKIFLPTYPFAKQFYWVSKSETETKHVEELTTNVNEKTVVRQFSIEEKVESYIMALVKKVLKLDEKDIDFSAEIADYGIDSIMSSIMISDLKELVPDVPPLLFLEQNTFNDVVSYLIEDFSDCFQEMQPEEKVAQKKITEEKKEVIEVKESQIEKLPEVTSNETPSNKSMDLAIVGISSLLPNTTSIQNFFNHMENGTSLVEVFPERRKELLNLTDEENKLLKDFYGAFIDDVENFDYTRFKFSKEEAVQIDPQLRKLIESVWNAIGDSGYSVKEFNKQETGVYVATRGNSGYAEIMQKNDLNYEVESPTLYANRLSHVFNLKGPSEVVDTACSSFIAAIQRARHAFERGDCKQAIVATATLNLSSKELTQEDLTGIYSKSGNTKSFSEDSDGFVRSEAIGTIVVKPLEEAKTAGDYIYGVIKGVGVYHGGKSPLKWNSPNIKGQKKAIEKALESAMIDPTTIDYVEAEANGVSFVDTSEMVSIQNVYGNYLKNSDNATDKKIYIGSSKPLMGHAEASSTFPCLLKLLASFQKEKLFGVNGLTEINKGITVDANFEILKEDIQWEQPSDLPRRAAMNCLGIGGVNTHLILESYDNVSNNYGKENNFVFVFSDVNEEQLATQLKNVSSSIKDLETTMGEVEILNRIEYTLQQGRTTEKCRLAFIASSLLDMKNHIDNWLSDQESWSNEINRFYGANFAKPTSEQLAHAIETKDWKLLAEYWVSGATVSWQKTNENSSLKRFPIPTTSLRKTSCWPHEISDVSTFEQGNSSEYIPLYTRIEGQNSSPYTLDKDHLFLFDLQWKAEFSEDSGSNSELEKHTILAYLDTEIPENYSGKKLEKPTDFTEQTFTELVNTSFLYIKDLIKQKPKKEVVVQIVLPKSCIHNSYGLTGLVHTSRQESTKIKTQLIFIEDLSDKEELVSILNENTNCLQDRVIKYENGVRYVEYAAPKHVLTNPINTEITYKEDDVILVTGGLGGLGITCAEDIIANSSKATIILVGRSSLNDKKQATLNKLNSGTHTVVYLPTDISNETQVSELIEKIIVDYKKLDGIIHCAGVIRDSYIMKKTVEEIKDVFEPKVYGAKYLDTHTKDIELRFFLCFSSLHSLGNPGQSDYAMSNSYVDGFVRERNLLVAKGERFGFSIAMNWPYWKSGGMQLSGLAIDLMTMTKGSVPMPNEIGMEIMHYALQNNIEQLFVDMGIFDKIVKQHNIQLKELSMEIS